MTYMSLPEFQTGHAKRNPANGDIAIRTDFPESGDLAGMAWLVATASRGALHHSSAQVVDWEDLHIPGGTE